jgi:transcriptional pleiotropic regulator of transition state genes
MEKSTRKLDELGRIVLPIELRRSLDITEQSEVEIWEDPIKKQIIIQKMKPCCMCCGSENDLKAYQNKMICSVCQSEIAKL